jgi:LysM repeat protein
MGRKIFYRIFLTAILILPAVIPSWSQVVVERSKEKVVISGKPYYVHQVKKGETAYSISKAYGITVEELAKENPPAVYGLNEGQALRIPVREVSENTQPQSRPARRDETRFIYHKLQPGETVYSLSKLYGVSENEIISANRGIDITRLPVGAEIAVPKREFMTDRQEFAVQESNYIFHKVVKGESLSSIADKYGLTVRELRKENRNIRFPQVGDYIRIPVPKSAETVISEPPKPDTAKAEAETPVIILQRPSGYTQVRNLTGSLDVAVLLPFYLRENASRTYIDSSKVVKGRNVPRVVKRPDDWIYTRSLGFLEMYEGILLATDTLRSLGLDISLHVYDIKNDTLELTRLIARGDLDSMDLIIGPVYSSNLAIMTAYANKIGIPVVSPVPLLNNMALVNNPNLFIANTSIDVAQNAISKKIGEYYADNFVFIHTDTAGVDPDVKNFKEKILRELSNRLPFEEIKFKEFLFYSRSVFGSDSINRLSHTLTSSSDNIIIIASEEGPVVSEILQDVHTLSKKYPVKVFGYPSMRGLDNLEPKFIFDLDILMFSPSWIDYSRKDVMRFNSDFRQKFLTEPHEMSYAWLGYDIAYYFLSGMAIHGKIFSAHPEIHNPDLLETEFDFQRKSASDGFENQKLFPVRYARDYEIRLEAESSPVQ